MQEKDGLSREQIYGISDSKNYLQDIKAGRELS